MKILIINGSPKGKYSITLQTCSYIKNHNPEHDYACLNAGLSINLFEKDFSHAAKVINAADLIIFAYPVYTFLAPSQLHRFIDLMKKNCDNGVIDLKNKYVTQISTSKHFYDITAHKYIEENCVDMGMKVIKGLSADMDDLTKEQGRKDALSFFNHVMFKMGAADKKDTTSENPLKDVVVVADIAPEDKALKEMVDEFLLYTDKEAKLINIHDFPFKGGCLSCFNCSSDGTCIYTDGFQEMLRNEIHSGSAIVLAFSISNHSMGSIFKTYDDRQFCNGHRTVTMGKPFAYIINGKLSQENNLKTVIEARAAVGGNYLAGIATNEIDMKSSIIEMAKDLRWCIENEYTQPADFYGVGGMKIFRDLIFEMQGLMRADYKFFKDHGQMDFPQKHPGKIALMYLVGEMMNNDKLKSKMGGKMKDGMLAPYRKYTKKQ